MQISNTPSFKALVMEPPVRKELGLNDKDYKTLQANYDKKTGNDPNWDLVIPKVTPRKELRPEQALNYAKNNKLAVSMEVRKQNSPESVIECNTAISKGHGLSEDLVEHFHIWKDLLENGATFI